MVLRTFSGDTWILYCQSSDTKPTPNFNDEYYCGHPIVVYEQDTGKVFMYNYTTKTYQEQ